MNNLSFSKKLNYNFKSIFLLEEALTHNSAVYENPELNRKSNQRLEFLGDSVLNLVIGNYLYAKLQENQEGRLSKLRAMIVCEKSLANVGKKLQLQDEIKMGKNEKTMKVNEKISVIADTVEAIIGAIFVDGGYEAAEKFVLSAFRTIIEKAIDGALITDYKTKIQEILQKDGETSIIYRVEKEEGPPHDKTFVISMWNRNNKLGTGTGKTKKEAEQKAAKAALEVKSVL